MGGGRINECREVEAVGRREVTARAAAMTLRDLKFVPSMAMIIRGRNLTNFRAEAWAGDDGNGPGPPL